MKITFLMPIVNKFFAMSKIGSPAGSLRLKPSKGPQTAEEMSKEIQKLKKEFQEKFEKNESSLPAERLSDFFNYTILGQGAFGVVVSAY